MPSFSATKHREFGASRVKAANMRKELFRVTLRDAEEAVERLAPEADFFKDREAQEWHETIAKRTAVLEQLQDGPAVALDDDLPAAI